MTGTNCPLPSAFGFEESAPMIHRFPAGTVPSSAEELVGPVLECVKAVSHPDQWLAASGESNLFRDLSLDSVQLLQLMSLLDEVAGREIPQHQLNRGPLETVNQVANLLFRVLTTDN